MRPILSAFFRGVTLSRRLVPLFLFAAIGQLVAGPGDTTHTYSTTDTSNFPPYSTFTQFADQISGSSTGAGFQSAAYRFTAGASGPMEYIQVILYGVSGGANEASARVVLYSDAGGKLGGPIAAFPVSGIINGSFKGYFAYHNYSVLGPNDTAYIITKGQSYWIGVEPLTPNSFVYWAASLDTREVKKYRNVGGNSTYPGGSGNTPDGFTVSVFEPFPPQVQSPGVPLVEGEQVPAEPNGVTLGSVGAVPQTPCLGSILVSKKKTPVILGSDGKVKLRIGDPAPTLADTAIKSLSEPSGDLVLATLVRQKAINATPAVTASNDVVLIGGVQTPPLRIVARSGEAIVGGGGATIGKFLSLDGNGTTSFFLVQLAGMGVSGKNNTALAAAVGTAAAHVLVRKDDLVGTAKVTILGTLAGFSDSVSEGRWRANDGALGVRLTLNDKSQHLFTIPGTAMAQSDWVAWSVTGVPLGAPLAGAVIKTMGNPGFGPDGVIFPATLQVGPGGVTKLDDVVLLQQKTGGFTVVARKGHSAPGATGDPIEDTNFKSFGNPVYGPAGKVAFIGTLAAKNPAGIWWSDGTNPLRLIARTGTGAPTYGTFSKFTNLVLPNSATGAPIFEAKLLTQAAASVNSATSDGVWALNSAGELTLVIRNGNYVYLNGNLYGTLSGLAALSATANAPGAEHGIDTNGAVRVNATIANRATTPMVKKRTQFSVPIPPP